MYAIDVSTVFGTAPTANPGYGVEKVLRRMESHGIAAALTVSLRGVHDDHVSGNAETLAACRAHPPLIPVATINPLRGFGLTEDAAQIKAGGFKAIRLFPGVAFQDWSAASLSAERVLRAVASLGLPIIAPGHIGAHIAPLARLTHALGLPLVLVNAYYYTQAEAEEALRRFPNVYLDTGHLGTPDAITLLAREFGAERILYGSDAPVMGPQASLNMVFRADLTPDQKEMVLAGNAMRLFGIAASSIIPAAAEACFRAYAGPKIDVHAHLHASVYRFPMSPAGPDFVLDSCRRYNIETVIASSAPGIFYDMASGNAEMKALIDGHPELRGYVVVNANDLAGSAEQLEHYYKFDNFIGAKIHCEYSGQPTASPAIRALFAEIARYDRPVKIHNNGSGWEQALHDLATAHPRLPIILAHGGGFDTPKIMKDVPNVYFEFAGSGINCEVIRNALDVLGPERLLFGTDQDLFDAGFELGGYWDAGLTPEQAEMIMYTNAKRVFGL
jgi:predicted TIM-barrel fold metal-dependent hydrolase